MFVAIFLLTQVTDLHAVVVITNIRFVCYHKLTFYHFLLFILSLFRLLNHLAFLLLHSLIADCFLRPFKVSTCYLVWLQLLFSDLPQSHFVVLCLTSKLRNRFILVRILSVPIMILPAELLLHCHYDLK